MVFRIAHLFMPNMILLWSVCVCIFVFKCVHSTYWALQCFACPRSSIPLLCSSPQPSSISSSLLVWCYHLPHALCLFPLSLPPFLSISLYLYAMCWVQTNTDTCKPCSTTIIAFACVYLFMLSALSTIGTELVLVCIPATAQLSRIWLRQFFMKCVSLSTTHPFHFVVIFALSFSRFSSTIRAQFAVPKSENEQKLHFFYRICNSFVCIWL